VRSAGQGGGGYPAQPPPALLQNCFTGKIPFAMVMFWVLAHLPPISRPSRPCHGLRAGPWWSHSSRCSRLCWGRPSGPL